MFGFNRRPPKTLDTVIASFTDTIRDLREIAAEKTEEASDAQEKINDLMDQQKNAIKDSDRAAKILTKLEALISG